MGLRFLPKSNPDVNLSGGPLCFFRKLLYMDNGFIVLWRKFSKTSFYRNSYTVHLAIHLLLKANHSAQKIIFKDEEITIQRGECIIGRKTLVAETGINGSTAYKKLKILEKVGFCNNKSNNRFTIVTICNYNSYQNYKSGRQQQKEQLGNNWVTTREQLGNTNNNDNNDNNDNNKTHIHDDSNHDKDKNNNHDYDHDMDMLSGCLPDLDAPILYLNEKTKSNFDPRNKTNRELVRARYREKRTLEQFKIVIDKKFEQWFTDEKMSKFLRPSTLFNRTNFENYLNEVKTPEIYKYMRKE